ncbi:hypothetical protein D7Z26_15725 [Cohnella endophytica]|uniref:Accessory regulator AgrB n=1 Tax=Cohnella endophytica TaxID=2419778 RepID=A0A494XRD0_9BACL|nr:accessory gene regulator B family protein [Cohnella endophytica]RKP53175.1 hypothetical protein D7Z26_15725 [Cohnella endophytica]
MIEALSHKISDYVYRHNERGHVSREVMQFAINSILSNSITFTLSLLIGLIDGAFWGTAMSLVAIALMRNLTGGYHFKSTTACIVVSTAAVTVIPFIPVSDVAMYAMNAVALGFVIAFAPSNLRGVTRLSERQLQRMKWVGAILIAANFFYQSDILSLAFFVQSISLISGKRGENDDA